MKGQSGSNMGRCRGRKGGHQIADAAMLEQGRALAGIERGKILVAGGKGGTFEMSQEPGLDREGRQAIAPRFHFGDDPIGNAARQAACIGAREHGVAGPVAGPKTGSSALQ